MFIVYKITITLLFIALFINLVEAHVCDDVLRHDPIEIRPEMQTVRIVEQGEFRIFLRNNYGASIHNVRVIVPENFFDIKVIPALIEIVLPRQEVYFLVKITIPKDVKPGTYPLVMKVDALEFAVPRDVQVTLKVEERETIVEIIPEDIPVAISIFPDIIHVEPGRTTQFRVYVRNGHTKSIHNIRLLVNETRFKINITPEIIEEIKAGEITYFLVDLFVPADVEYGDYMLAIELNGDEFAVNRRLGVVIRVGEVVEEITYIYLLVILFFLFILVWRMLRISTKRATK